MEDQSGFEANMFNSSSIIYVLAVPETNLLVFTYTDAVCYYSIMCHQPDIFGKSSFIFGYASCLFDDNLSNRIAFFMDQVHGFCWGKLKNLLHLRL